MILSPYRAQLRMLRRFFEEDPYTNPIFSDIGEHVMTVDSAQGRQAEVVVVSLVRNNTASGETEPQRAYGFLEQSERIGVMLSRAESLLIVIGCSAHFRAHPLLSDVHAFIEDLRGPGLRLECSDFDIDLDKLQREHVKREKRKAASYRHE